MAPVPLITVVLRVSPVEEAGVFLLRTLVGNGVFASSWSRLPGS